MGGLSRPPTVTVRRSPRESAFEVGCRCDAQRPSVFAAARPGYAPAVMNESLVATVLGEDRAGLVESIARVVAGHDGNWVESRMSRLAGRFAGILRVDVSGERAAALAEALRGLASSGLTVVVESSVGGDRPSGARRMKLELVGQDRPGIVREISGVLVRHGVSVDELQTECSSAPESGGTLFRAAASLHVPASVATLDLRTALERIADDLMVDVVLEEPGRAAHA